MQLKQQYRQLLQLKEEVKHRLRQGKDFGTGTAVVEYAGNEYCSLTEDLETIREAYLSVI